ncbi:MAG: NADP-dependent oxidoreductase [Woeseiaceae bacterium]
MTDLVNRQWTVAAHPTTGLDLSDFGFQESPIVPPGDGEILLRTHYLNVAPVMRMYMMNDASVRTPERSLSIGDVIHGRGVAEVIDSRHVDFSVGDFVHGQLGWQTHKTTRVTPQEKFIRMQPRALPAYYGLSALGMTGYSAYCGFMLRGEPKPSDHVLVSGAAGGVGSLVVQLAKAVGCEHVIGIAGTQEKCMAVKSLGADDCINYKTEDVDARIAALMPDGIDVYFDNVGGDILEMVLERLRLHARVVMCGAISEYTRKEPFGPRNYGRLRSFDADMRGFFVYNHQPHFAQAEDHLAALIHDGKLTALIDIADGFEQMPKALIGLYTGANVGKRVVRVNAGTDVIY